MGYENTFPDIPPYAHLMMAIISLQIPRPHPLFVGLFRIGKEL